eukprot:3633444-Ditylum_brightwellii.AAC.1
MQPLDKDEVLDILEFGVPASWRREFIVQGFDPVDQGLRKFVEFCTRLESCELNKDKPKVEKTGKTWGRKHKAEVLTTPTATTTTTADLKYYYKKNEPNRTHNTKDCFELKQHAKRAKADTNCGRADKVTYKDLNASVNAKVTAALNKAKNNQKKKEKSSNEESDHKVNTLATTSDNDSDIGASCADSDESRSYSK